MKVFGGLLILIFVTLSCQQKSVQLPALDVIGIQDTVYNNSKIWMFYSLKGNDTIVELNKNNSIANTHWIFNIDKRLLLKQVVPKIQQLQAKKEKPSMHDNGEISHSYYSYVDTISNKLSLILFDSVKFITTQSENFDSLSPPDNFRHLSIQNTNNGIIVNNINIDINKINDYLSEQLDSVSLKIHLNFDKNLSYQDYIHLKALLQNIKSDSIIFDHKEFVDLE